MLFACPKPLRPCMFPALPDGRQAVPAASCTAGVDSVHVDTASNYYWRARFHHSRLIYVLSIAAAHSSSRLIMFMLTVVEVLALHVFKAPISGC
eukprot:6177794-Pleurochrysis_carterae.AAC.1